MHCVFQTIKPGFIITILISYLNRTKAHIQQLVSKAQACPDLMLTAMGLKALQIKGVGFAEMFAPFGDVDHFCGK